MTAVEILIILGVAVLGVLVLAPLFADRRPELVVPPVVVQANSVGRVVEALGIGLLVGIVIGLILAGL